MEAVDDNKFAATLVMSCLDERPDYAGEGSVSLQVPVVPVQPLVEGSAEVEGLRQGADDVWEDAHHHRWVLQQVMFGAARRAHDGDFAWRAWVF